MEGIYFEYSKIENTFSKTNEYKNLLENIDYYFELFTNMYYGINNFYSMQISFNDVSFTNLTEEKFNEEFFISYLNNIKKTNMLDLSILFNNCKSTLYSFRKCIEVINISDALTLFRKFKDDYLLFIYFVKLGSPNETDYNTIEKLKSWNDYVDDANNWANNRMGNVYYTKVIKFLKTDPKISKLDDETNCFEHITHLTKNLNNFAHSNGISFINNYNPIYNKQETLKLLYYINKELDLVCSYLLTILFTISPHYLMSNDYIDYKDAGQEPPEGSQYWIAPFYQDYIDNKLSNTKSILKQFLIENTCMQIN
jgi:hypothetical protein